ncbi:hypothetical protein RFI_34641, partial [Reticulomyxa filosa]
MLLVCRDSVSIIISADFIDLWNALIKDKKATSYTLKMVCGLLSSFKKVNNKVLINNNKKKRRLEITKENKKMTWYPKDSNDPNFHGEMEQKNWKKYFKDLKQLIGGLSDGEYLEDGSQTNKIEIADDLKRIWADRYDEHDSNKWSLKFQLVCSHSSEKSTSKVVPTKNKSQMQGEHFNIKLILEEAANTIQNQNVILMLGGTGTGKSTLVHFLAGSTLEKQIINKTPHIAPVKIKNEAL